MFALLPLLAWARLGSEINVSHDPIRDAYGAEEELLALQRAQSRIMEELRSTAQLQQSFSDQNIGSWMASVNKNRALNMPPPKIVKLKLSKSKCDYLKTGQLAMMSENDSIVPKEAAMAELRAGQLVLRYNRVIERVLDLHHADLPVANVGTFKHCFTLQYKNNEVLLCGPSEQMAHSWINAITEAWFCEFEGIRGLCMPTDMAALQEKLDALEKKKEEEKKRKREEARQARIEARKEGKATPPEEDAERDEKKEDAEEKDAKDSIVDVQVKVDELGVPQVEVEGKAFTGGQKPAEDQGQEEIKEQTAGIPQAESTTPAPQATGELDS